MRVLEIEGKHCYVALEALSSCATGTKGTVFVMKGKARLFKEGNPLVYGGAVETALPSTLAIGDLVYVRDKMGNQIGCGVYNPESMYRVRLLAHTHEAESLGEVRTVRDLVGARLRYAKVLRESLELPNSRLDTHTTAYRLVNGEGDRLSGLVVDVFGDIIVAQASAYWVQKYKDDILAELAIAMPGTKTVWRSNYDRLMQDGWGKNTTVVDDPASAEAQDEAASTEKGEENENAAPRPEQEQVAPIDRHVLITENGLRFLATPFSGQKTGFYCDQRENRALVRELCPQGGTVLDLYCYTGAFAVHAAVGGASRVHAVDSSLNAIEVGRENARLNKVEDIVTFEKSDALEYMRRAAQEGLTFDMVVVDPPKLAPTKKSLDRAAPMYTRINALALSLVRRGGLLFTFSCSGSVARGDAGGLLGLVQAAARTVGREVTVLRETGPACCHTLNPCYTEGRYLTALLVGVR